jgi:hypothetical protein
MTSPHPDLFSTPPEPDDIYPAWVDPFHPKTASNRERFDAFHHANPWVADALEAMAIQAVRDGCRRIGMKHFVEVLRFKHRYVNKVDDWRFNNNHTSYYARLIVERRPELRPYIEIRHQRAA